MDRNELAKIARGEAANMMAAAGTANAESEVRMTVGNFTKLAQMLSCLAALPGEPARSIASADEPGPGSWVPLPYYERLRGALAELRGENEQLRLAAAFSLDSMVAFE